MPWTWTSLDTFKGFYGQVHERCHLFNIISFLWVPCENIGIRLSTVWDISWYQSQRNYVSLHNWGKPELGTNWYWSEKQRDKISTVRNCWVVRLRIYWQHRGRNVLYVDDTWTLSVCTEKPHSPFSKPRLTWQHRHLLGFHSRSMLLSAVRKTIWGSGLKSVPETYNAPWMWNLETNTKIKCEKISREDVASIPVMYNYVKSYPQTAGLMLRSVQTCPQLLPPTAPRYCF